ncbi:hypothetical protein GCM10010094_92480 [Streptomyces flaveus]|uniref:Uncharacterized protein n=1 Tax=Streptomyces flaveus TaxID=66370 RepID=A0A917RPK2_9ACTN|nr:hypothetical protein GCM10010094_92480 [Streptomyces flaveus]
MGPAGPAVPADGPFRNSLSDGECAASVVPMGMLPAVERNSARVKTLRLAMVRADRYLIFDLTQPNGSTTQGEPFGSI